MNKYHVIGCNPTWLPFFLLYDMMAKLRETYWWQEDRDQETKLIRVIWTLLYQKPQTNTT